MRADLRDDGDGFAGSGKYTEPGPRRALPEERAKPCKIPDLGLGREQKRVETLFMHQALSPICTILKFCHGKICF
jgi:hypothetical protein